MLPGTPAFTRSHSLVGVVAGRGPRPGGYCDSPSAAYIQRNSLTALLGGYPNAPIEETCPSCPAACYFWIVRGLCVVYLDWPWSSQKAGVKDVLYSIQVNQSWAAVSSTTLSVFVHPLSFSVCLFNFLQLSLIVSFCIDFSSTYSMFV